uniref:Cytochrome P450 n=1 Tax=Heligmosomoides polygyrus TaxID=6339 RepID=A0A183G532_HELPZ
LRFPTVAHFICVTLQYFGRPRDFFPNHFDVDACSSRSAYAFIPFSAGPRNCIGKESVIHLFTYLNVYIVTVARRQRFAVMEEKVLLARLVRQFRFRATMTFQENRGLPELVLRPSRGVPLIVERRLE